ncbi:MAG: dihydroorotase, partial [Actinomycetota bacterium]
MKSFVIRGGTVVNPDGNIETDVVVRDGFVVAPDQSHSDLPVVDATGCYVSSGFVDLHTHLREPGKEEAETIET